MQTRRNNLPCKNYFLSFLYFYNYNFLLKKISGKYLTKNYTFLTCTQYAFPSIYDGAFFSSCRTDNCNYDDTLANSSNTVSSCNVGGSFYFSDSYTSNYNKLSCPPSSNSYCMVILFILNKNFLLLNRIYFLEVRE